MSKQQKDLIQVIAATQNWHAGIIDVLDKVIATPADSEIEIQLGEDPETALQLSPEERRGFRIAIICFKEVIAKLPFEAKFEDNGEDSKEAEPVTVYVFTEDLGDGSNAVRYTLDPDLLDRLCVGEYADYFLMNEGYADTLTFPAGFDFEAAGFDFYNEE